MWLQLGLTHHKGLGLWYIGLQNAKQWTFIYSVTEYDFLSVEFMGMIRKLVSITAQDFAFIVSMIVVVEPKRLCKCWNLSKFSIVDRFDLIFLILDPQDEVYDRKLANHLVSLYYRGEEEEEAEYMVHTLLPLWKTTLRKRPPFTLFHIFWLQWTEVNTVVFPPYEKPPSWEITPCSGILLLLALTSPFERPNVKLGLSKGWLFYNKLLGGTIFAG